MTDQRYALLEGTNVTDVRIPLIGLGTWPMTGPECQEAVSSALEAGYRHLDTAENYGNEVAVGRAVNASGLPREEVFVTSKFNRRWHGGTDTVRAALEASLERTGLEYLDLFLVHWPNPDQGRYVQACESLADLAQTGLLRSWGVSNFSPEHLQAVLDAGLVPSVNQVYCEPLDAQRPVQEADTAAGVLTAAYTPIGRGSGLLQHEVITGIARRLDRTPAQVVLRWHVQQGRIAIPKSGHPQRQRENLDVFSFALGAEDQAAIDALDVSESGGRSANRADPEEFGH